MTKINKQAVAEAIANYVVVSAVDKLQHVPRLLINKLKQSVVFTMTVNQGDEVYMALEDWLYLNYESSFKDVTISARLGYIDEDDFDLDSPIDVGKSDVPNWTPDVSSNTSIVAKMKGLLFGSNAKLTKVDTENKSPSKQSTRVSLNSGSVVLEHMGSTIHITKSERENRNKDTVEFYVLTSNKREAVKDLIDHIYVRYNIVNDEARLFLSTAYGEWRFNKVLSGKSIDNVILPDAIENSLIKDIDVFCKEKEWYNSLNIPYKRGYLLYGPPGNGKTSLSIAIANHYGRNIYCMDLNAFMTDEQLRYAFDQLQNDSVLLIEDVDRAFTSKRENNDSKGITFSCLLNCLDGVFQKEGLVTIMTTNYISQLDAALIRPGRIDMKIFIDNPSIHEINKYLRKFYLGNVEECVVYGGGYSMAEIQELCIRNKNTPHKALEELKHACGHLNIVQDLQAIISHNEEFIDTFAAPNPPTSILKKEKAYIDDL